jgi:hypothetical protein
MDYDYSKISYLETTWLPPGYKGNVYNMSYKWKDIIPTTRDPIRVMEIGAYHGANVCCLTKSHAIHTGSEIHVIDPWTDYKGYDEYKDEQAMNYANFMRNISKLSPCDLAKIFIHRMKSEEIDKKFADEMFDIIYIDGNHKTKFVLEDSIMAYKKIKRGGWIVFDDVFDPEVKEGIQIFLHLYKSYFASDIHTKNGQLFIQRLARD